MIDYEEARRLVLQYLADSEAKSRKPAFLPRLPQQRGASSAARLGVQPGQLSAHARLARGGGALVADDASREANQV